jgi:hypothetical protein
MAFSNEQHRQRYAQDPGYRERKLAANRAYNAEHRDRLNELRREKWRARRIRDYGLTAEDLERMLIEQGGLCAICRRSPARRLCIDHCHATQRVRGLLCDNCNMALGLLDDDPDRLRAAIAYVLRARGVAEARGGCRAEMSAVMGGASFEASFGAASHTLRLRAEVGVFRLAGDSHFPTGDDSRRVATGASFASGQSEEMMNLRTLVEIPSPSHFTLAPSSPTPRRCQRARRARR